MKWRPPTVEESIRYANRETGRLIALNDLAGSDTAFLVNRSGQDWKAALEIVDVDWRILAASDQPQLPGKVEEWLPKTGWPLDDEHGTIGTDIDSILATLYREACAEWVIATYDRQIYPDVKSALAAAQQAIDYGLFAGIDPQSLTLRVFTDPSDLKTWAANRAAIIPNQTPSEISAPMIAGCAFPQPVTSSQSTHSPPQIHIWSGAQQPGIEIE